MDPINELDVITDFNELGLSIRYYEKIKKEYPLQFKESIARELQKLKSEKVKLGTILSTMKGSLIMNKRRLICIEKIQKILNEFNLAYEEKITANQGLMFENYIFYLIANDIAKIVYSEHCVLSHTNFQRSKRSDFDIGELPQKLTSILKWLKDNHLISYFEFEEFMDQKLIEIISLSNSKNAA